MSGRIIAYLLPGFPLLSFLILALVFRSTMAQSVGDSRRMPILERILTTLLAGLAYGAMLALASISSLSRLRLDLPIYYLLLSFLAYYLAGNIQRYRQRRWHEQVSQALLDVGSLSLILAALALILDGPFSDQYRLWLGLTAFVIWYADHLVRVTIAAQSLSRVVDRELRAQRRSSSGVRRTVVGDAVWYLLKGYKSE